MKKVFIILALFITSLATYAQDIKLTEPEFSGESLLVKADGSGEPLQKATYKLTTKASIKLINSGYKQKVVLDGCCSAVTAIPNNGVVKILVRATDNKVDPSSIIKVIQFETSKKERSAELMSFEGLKGANEGGNLKQLLFSAKKFGESSYLLTVSVPASGEYGILLTGLNYISTFNVK